MTKRENRSEDKMIFFLIWTKETQYVGINPKILVVTKGL